MANIAKLRNIAHKLRACAQEIRRDAEIVSHATSNEDSGLLDSLYILAPANRCIFTSALTLFIDAAWRSPAMVRPKNFAMWYDEEILGLTCRERCTVRHVRDGVRFDELIAFSVDPDLTRIALDH